jgi:cobalamin biosynthesis Mg chelatase CobN
MEEKEMKKLFGRAAALLAAAVIAVGMPSVTVKATEATTVAAGVASDAENAETTTVASDVDNAETTTVAEEKAEEATEATTEASTAEAQADTVEDTDVGEGNADEASSDPDFIAGEDAAATTEEESSSGISKVAIEIICLGVIALIGVVIIVKKT